FEFIKDRILELDWEDAQELVAGILRAMGYKTRVSPKGPDLGKDIVASPDGLGLEQPRIRVEVKHRPRQQIGAPDIRSFIGALRAGDKGLYVSTGGFSTEARYEAERATIPITLVDLNELVKLLIQHYESSDLSTRALVPLVRMYWPTT
ncbi:MAG: restriction endonuclease, partial [Elusimicrobiales bacterium]|nr:restriction endonuclease [Elusimicrobiales bacterium]